MNKLNERLKLLLVLLVSFFGGMVSSYIFTPQVSEAFDLKRLQALLSNQMQIVNEEGKVLSDFSEPRQDGLAFSVYDDNGTKRIQFGTDDGNDLVTEHSRPFFALFDNKERMRLVFHLKGGQEVPTITLKDQLGNPRFEIGLDPAVVDELPFMKYYDIYGVEHQIFGEQAYK